LHVAEALVDPRYLSRSHAIQYRSYRMTQVSVSYDGALFAVYRRPLEDGKPWPTWRSTRGDSFSCAGSSGLWLPHVPDLLADCKLVPLAADDRPPPHQRYSYRHGGWPVEDGPLIAYPAQDAA
jgi:hypothetical protein